MNVSALRAYSGHTSPGAWMTALLRKHGIGEMWTAGQDKWPPTRKPFAIDCGTFSPWRNRRRWDEGPFIDAVARCDAQNRPDFVICPDLIGKGTESLALSLSWRARLHGFPVFLAVQDGMRPHQVGRVLHRFDGVFVGGTLAWKLRVAGGWVRLAHSHGKPCHIGRIGIPRRVRWAQRIGADSIDSCQPLWSRKYIAAWLAAVGETHPQMELKCASR